MKKNKLLKILIAIVLLINIESSVIAVSTGIVNSDTVRVRKEATTESEIVELVSIGDKITITGEEGSWYKVKIGKVVGYIRKDLLTVDGKNITTTPSEENNNQEPKVDNPSNQEPKVDNPTNQEPNSEVTAPTNADIVTDNNKNDRTISTIQIGKGVSVGQKEQLTSETKIKILPSANSTNIATLKANTEITVIDVVNKWCRIETQDGTCGWVRINN